MPRNHRRYYESIDDVVITRANEDKVFSIYIDSTEVKVNSVYDYTEFLMNWTELVFQNVKRR